MFKWTKVRNRDSESKEQWLVGRKVNRREPVVGPCGSLLFYYSFFTECPYPSWPPNGIPVLVPRSLFRNWSVIVINRRTDVFDVHPKCGGLCTRVILLTSYKRVKGRKSPLGRPTRSHVLVTGSTPIEVSQKILREYKNLKTTTNLLSPDGVRTKWVRSPMYLHPTPHPLSKY